MLAAFQSKMERSRKLAEYVSAGVADVDDDDDDKQEEDEEEDNATDLSWWVCVSRTHWPQSVCLQWRALVLG